MKILFWVAMILMTFTTVIWAQEAATPKPMDTPSMESGSFDTAMHLYRQKRYQDAIGEFEKVVAADPKNAAAYYFMGYAHYVKGHHQEALAAFKKAFEANPAFDPRPYYRR